MKKLMKVTVSSILVLCFLSIISIGIFAENIPITHQYGSSTGYSNHVEYTPLGVRGFSEGNCVHNSSDNIYYYATVSGSSTYKYLRATVISPYSGTTVYYDSIEQVSITSNPQINFNRTYRTEIKMEESAFTGNDRWNATYLYIWDYYSSESRMTLIQGTYN